MKVIASALGIVLFFESKKELKGVIQHLQGHIGWIEQENANPPYLYSIHDDRIPREEIEEMFDKLKEQKMMDIGKAASG